MPGEGPPTTSARPRGARAFLVSGIGSRNRRHQVEPSGRDDRHDGPLSMLRRGVEPAKGDNPAAVVRPKQGATPKGESFRRYTGSLRELTLGARCAGLHP